MYRCMACDAPTQARCDCTEQISKDFEAAMAAMKKPDDGTGGAPAADPWGWQEQPKKLVVGYMEV